MENKEHFVITINRELGSGGCTIGKLLAERLGVKYYDKALVHELTSEFNLTEEELERVKAKKQNWWSDFCQSYNQRYDINLRKDPSPKAVTTEAVFHVESRLLKGLASKESCVVMGRSGFYIFRDTPGALRVLILCNDMQKRTAWCAANISLRKKPRLPLPRWTVRVRPTPNAFQALRAMMRETMTSSSTLPT